MRIERIQITGLKGADGTSVDLPSTLFLHGPNGSGKSTIIDGVRLLLRGEHPDAGRGGKPAKEIDDVLTLAQGDELQVEGVVEHEGSRWTIGRRWSRRTVTRGRDSGMVKGSRDAWVIEPDGRRTDKLMDALAAIKRFVGPAAGLDLAELLGPDKTDTDRRVLLLSAAGSRSQWTPDAVTAELDRRNLPGVPRWTGTPGVADWLQDMWDRASSEVSEAHRELLRTREAAEKIAEGGIEGEPPSVDPETVRRARLAVEQAHEALREVGRRWAQALERAETDLQRGEQAETKRRSIQQGIDSTRATLAQVEAQAGGISPRVAELRARLAALRDELAKDGIPELEARLATSIEARERAEREVLSAREAWSLAEIAHIPGTGLPLSQAQIALGRAESHLRDQIEAATETQRRAADRTDREAEQAEGAAQELERIISAAEEMLEEAQCPVCDGALTPDVLVRARVKAGETRAKAGAAASAHAEARAKAKAAEEERLLPLQRAVNDARAVETAAATAAARAKATAEEAYTSANEARRVEQDERRLLDEARSEAFRLEKELATAEAHSADAELATLRERLQRHEADLRTVHVPDLPGLQRVLEEQRAQAARERGRAEEDLQTAQTALGPLDRALVLQQEITRLRAEVSQRELAWREAQRVEDELGPAGMMGVILAEILEPLESLVNAGLEGLDLGTFRVRLLDERNKPICRPGLERGDRWTSVETLSDGERASVLPILLPALATLIGGPYRLLMADAIERLDSTRREAFVRRVVALVREGRIDQAILAGCPDQVPGVDGCTVREVTA